MQREPAGDQALARQRGQLFPLLGIEPRRRLLKLHRRLPWSQQSRPWLQLITVIAKDLAIATKLASGLYRVAMRRSQWHGDCFTPLRNGSKTGLAVTLFGLYQRERI